MAGARAAGAGSAARPGKGGGVARQRGGQRDATSGGRGGGRDSAAALPLPPQDGGGRAAPPPPAARAAIFQRGERERRSGAPETRRGEARVPTFLADLSPRWPRGGPARPGVVRGPQARPRSARGPLRAHVALWPQGVCEAVVTESVGSEKTPEIAGSNPWSNTSMLSRYSTECHGQSSLKHFP